MPDPAKPKRENRFDLNDEGFSYVIFGTGLTESIIGAALAMHGHKCLYLDKADKYGGTIANFNLDQYLKYGKLHYHFEIKTSLINN